MIVAASLLLVSCQQESAEKATLPSGYEYILHTDAQGEATQPGALAYFHFKMRSPDSTVVSSFDQPYPQVMPVPDTSEARPLTPVEEALRVMTVGDSLTIIAPLDTLEQKPQGFEDSDVLYYDITLLSLKSQQEVDAEVAEVQGMVNETISKYEAGELENIQETTSGLKYIVHQEGTGKQPDSSDVVYVDYYGALTNGTSFDNSYKRGQPLAFPLGMGQVIEGWDEGISQLKEGAKATLFVPATLGYGERGAPPTIPGNSELVFYVELKQVSEQPIR